MGYHEHACLICADKDGCGARNCPEEYTCEGCRRDMRQLGDSGERLFGILIKRIQRLESAEKSL